MIKPSSFPILLTVKNKSDKESVVKLFNCLDLFENNANQECEIINRLSDCSYKGILLQLIKRDIVIEKISIILLNTTLEKKEIKAQLESTIFYHKKDQLFGHSLSVPMFIQKQDVRSGVEPTDIFPQYYVMREAKCGFILGDDSFLEYTIAANTEMQFFFYPKI